MNFGGEEGAVYVCFLSGFSSSPPCEFVYLFKYSACMTVILRLHVRSWSVLACLFQLLVCLNREGGVLLSEVSCLLILPFVALKVF